LEMKVMMGITQRKIRRKRILKDEGERN
jgi:hypothetical protein